MFVNLVSLSQRREEDNTLVKYLFQRPPIDLLTGWGEAFNQGGMVVLSYDTSSYERRELGSHTTRLIVPGALQDRGAFSRDRVLPNLSDLYGCAVRRAVGLRVPHTTESRTRESSEFNRDPDHPSCRRWRKIALSPLIWAGSEATGAA